MRRGKKKFIVTAVLMLLLLLEVLPAFGASGDTGKERMGSIEIGLKDLETENSSRNGVVMNAWKVGTVDEYGSPRFDASYGIKEYPQNAESLEIALEKISGMIRREADLTAVTDASGAAGFSQVEPGIYLIRAAEDNPYGKVLPILVQLPYWEEVEGQMQGPKYDVEVQPKASANPVNTPEPPSVSVTPTSPPAPSRSPKPAEKVSPTKTGDMALTEFYLILMTVSLAIVVLVRFVRKKQIRGRETEV